MSADSPVKSRFLLSTRPSSILYSISCEPSVAPTRSRFQRISTPCFSVGFGQVLLAPVFNPEPLLRFISNLQLDRRKTGATFCGKRKNRSAGPPGFSRYESGKTPDRKKVTKRGRRPPSLRPLRAIKPRLWGSFSFTIALASHVIAREPKGMRGLAHCAVQLQQSCRCS